MSFRRTGLRPRGFGRTGIGMTPEPGHLYLVATPIGNLGDLTYRARELLAAVDVIACEDTRHSQALLKHYGIVKPLVSLHEHNEASRSAQLVGELANGRTVACISDAGMPGVSDPGQRLVAACHRAGIPVDVLPGPSAVLTALIGSGLPSERFCFEGFLPVKGGQRERALRAALDRDMTTVFFESPHRIDRTLGMLAEFAPDRLICVAREMTKRFGEFRRGPAAEVNDHFRKHPPKGEICLVIAGTVLPKWLRAGAEPPEADPGDPTADSRR